MARAALFLVLVVLAAPIHAQSAEPDARLDSIFAEWDRPDSPGCAVSVLRAGEPIHARGYGSANLDYQVPITPNTVFYLASVSKQFTAAAVALAAEQGYLSLDDDIRRWFPELPDYDTPVRVRDLVHHTSGLRDYLTLMSLAGMPYGNVWTDDEILALIVRQRAINFTPGSAYLYSNSGYFLMALLVERATGLSLRDYTTREMFKPLGMHDTWFHDDATRVVRNRAVAYGPDDDGFRITHLFNFDKVGSGGLYSTLEDLARWDANLYESGVGGPGFVDTLHQRGVLTSGDALDYAFGLTLSEYRGLPTVGHGGSMMGFRTMFLRFPEERTSVITLCNLGTIDPGSLSREVADVVLADRLGAAPESTASGATERPDRPEPGQPASPGAAYAGRYHSPELEAVYAVAARDDELVLHGARGLEQKLTPLGGDLFRSERGLRVRFVRDETGIRGFQLDAGRVRGLDFKRVAEGG